MTRNFCVNTWGKRVLGNFHHTVYFLLRLFTRLWLPIVHSFWPENPATKCEGTQNGAAAHRKPSQVAGKRRLSHRHFFRAPLSGMCKLFMQWCQMATLVTRIAGFFGRTQYNAHSGDYVLADWHLYAAGRWVGGVFLSIRWSAVDWAGAGAGAAHLSPTDQRWRRHTTECRPLRRCLRWLLSFNGDMRSPKKRRRNLPGRVRESQKQGRRHELLIGGGGRDGFIGIQGRTHGGEGPGPPWDRKTLDFQGVFREIT